MVPSNHLFWDWQCKLVYPGWYAGEICYDVAEGAFPEVQFLDGGRWLQHYQSPITGQYSGLWEVTHKMRFYPVPFATEKEEQEFADNNIEGW